MLQYFKDKKYSYYQLNNVGTVYIIESSNTQLISLLNLKKKTGITKTDKLLFLMDSFVGASNRIEFANEYNRKEFVSILIDNEEQLPNKDISFCFAPLKYGDFQTWINNISSDQSDEIFSFISSNKDTFKGYIDEIINENEIDLFSPLKPIESIISTTNDGYINTIATNGNICLISGDSGIGKTKFSNLIIAAALNKYNAIIDTLGLNINTLDGLVVHFDTEQDKETIKQNINKMIFQPLGIENKASILKQYKPQSLVGLSPSEMMRNTERKLNALYRKFGKIDLILLDGAIDYADDFVSDAKQASIIASKAKFFADLYDCLVIVSMHLNPSRNGETNEKPSGILGSQLVRKAESSIVLVKQSKTQTIKVKFNKHRKSRYIPELEFRFNDYGIIESAVPIRTTEDLVIESAIGILYQLKKANQTTLVEAIAKDIKRDASYIKKEYIPKLESNPNFVITPKGNSKIYTLESDEFKKKSQLKLLGG